MRCCQFWVSVWIWIFQSASQFRDSAKHLPRLLMLEWDCCKYLGNGSELIHNN